MNAHRHTHQETFQNSVKIEELESIRGLAALLIVFFHLPKWNPILNNGFLNNSYLMVDIFFVLSGFVIFNAYAEKITTKEDLYKFQLLRLGRLYPVHLFFLFIFLGIEISKYFASTQLGINSPNSTPFETNNFSAFIYNIFLISSILPNQLPTYNYPAWSVSAEFYTYLLFATIVFFVKKFRIVLFTVLAMVSIFMLSTANAFGFEPMLRCIAGFFIGCITAKVMQNININLPDYFSAIAFFTIIVFLLLKTTKNLDFLIYFLTAMLIFAIVLSEDGILKKILRLRFLTWLGAISYSIYLSHAAIVWAANQITRVFFKKSEIIGVNGISTPQLSQLETVFACTAVVSVVLIVSSSVYKFVENPIREKSRRFVFSKFGGFKQEP